VGVRDRASRRGCRSRREGDSESAAEWRAAHGRRRRHESTPRDCDQEKEYSYATFEASSSVTKSARRAYCLRVSAVNRTGQRRQHRARWPLSWPPGIAACAILISAVPLVAQTATRAPARRGRVPAMADGRPDLQGTWTNNTATPLVRPADL